MFTGMLNLILKMFLVGLVLMLYMKKKNFRKKMTGKIVQE
jgi:hypothetical protein